MHMETIRFSNGVALEIQDKSSVLSGDLYMVHLEIITIVSLDDDDVELRHYCPSGRLRMTRVLRKSAVHERDLRQVKKAIKESFLNTNRPYIEHPKFIGRFKNTCLATYREQEEKARQTAVHEE